MTTLRFSTQIATSSASESSLPPSPPTSNSKATLSKLEGGKEVVLIDSTGALVQQEIAATSIGTPITFSNLPGRTTYRVRLTAYNSQSTSEGSLISVTDQSSYADVEVANENRPTLASMTLTLLDRAFDGQATSSFDITEGALNSGNEGIRQRPQPGSSGRREHTGLGADTIYGVPTHDLPASLGAIEEPSMSSRSVLRLALVEDESLFRDLLRGSLASLPGIEVVGAFGDADSALAAIPGLAPDVVLLDVNLGPGRNGIELGFALRRHLPELGIILLSNHRDPAFFAAIPSGEVAGWSYLLKTSVRDLVGLERAIHGSASGFVILDPRIAGDLGSDPKRHPELSERSRSLLKLLAEGHSNSAIAEQLCISEKTVENQLGALYRQLDIDTSDSSLHPRVQAALYFLRDDLA